MAEFLFPPFLFPYPKASLGPARENFSGRSEPIIDLSRPRKKKERSLHPLSSRGDEGGAAPLSFPYLFLGASLSPKGLADTKAFPLFLFPSVPP